MLAQTDPNKAKRKKHREIAFSCLNGLAVLLTGITKVGSLESGDSAEQWLAASRIAIFISFALPYIERMSDFQIVEGKTQRIAHHLYTGLVTGATAVAGASWGLAIGYIEIGLSVAATAMKYVIKCVPEDRKLADLLENIRKKIIDTADIADEDRRAGHIDGLHAAISAINAYLSKSAEAKISPEPLTTAAAKKASATVIYAANTTAPAQAVEQKK